MNKLTLALIIFAHIFILSKLTFFPYPELFIYPYLTNHGLLPYSQILDQHFPGLMFLPLNFDNLGMTTPEIARIWSIVIVIVVHLMLFIIGSEILKSKSKALFVNLLYLIWQPFFEGWVLWIDSLLPLFLLPAFYMLYKRKMFTAGLLLGIAVVFKQVLIPLAGLVLIYLIWQFRNKVTLKFLLGLFLPIIIMVVYLIKIGVFKDFWYWTVIFNLTTFSQYGRQTVPSFAHILRVGVVFGVSIVGLLAKDKKTTQILLIFIIGSLIGVLIRFDFVHFQPALPFVLLSTVIGINAIWRKTLSKVIICVYFLILVWWLIIFYKGHIGNRVLFFDSQTYQLVDKIKQNTKPGEKIFIFGAVPHLYQMSQTKPAGDIFVFQFPWFLKVAEDRILEGIKKDQPQIIVSDRTVKIEDQLISDFAKKIDQYIQEFYEKIDYVRDTEILRRK